MKRFIDWLKRDTPQQSNGSEAYWSAIDVCSRQQETDEYGDDSSFSWFGIDPDASSIFDAGGRITD